MEYASYEKLQYALNTQHNSFLLQPVGCDDVVGSQSAVDRCGVCNGDSTSCRAVKKQFTTYWEKKGKTFVPKVFK